MSARAVAAALALAASLGAAAPGLAAQAPTEDAFLDADARALHGRARARWHEIDGSLARYQAVVSQRFAAALRLPLRDRTLYASETSARVIWERDGGLAVQMLGARERLPPGTRRSGDRPPLFDNAFDPAGDPLLLGLSEWGDDGDLPFQHPLDVQAERHYRFRTADTLVLSFPDGRTLRAVQLDVLPRRDDPFLVSGALWIEPETGNLARAVYRLARPLNFETDTDEVDDDFDRVPGLFRPFTAEVTMIAVDYALWDLRVWMPRSLRAEGTARAGILSMPVAIEMAYELEEVVTDEQPEPELGLQGSVERLARLAEEEGETGWRVDPHASRRHGRRVRYLVPEDPAWLAESPHRPAPIWEADAQFVRESDLEELKDVLEDLPGPARVTPMATFDWGLQRPDLVRYNRVEGLSVGARGAVRFGATGVPVSASLTARLGSADLQPRGVLALTRETLERSIAVTAYRELQLVEPASRALGFGNSVNAFLFGRDDGDYFDALGVALTLAPPASTRAWYRARLYLERQDSVVRETDGSVSHWIGIDDGFRAAPSAVRADQVGAELVLSPWWGLDPRGAAGGVELQLQGERGDFEFARARAQARVTLPLPRGARVALAAGAGATFGAAPPQRLWLVGGPWSVRGFAPGVRTGADFGTARLELMGPLRDLRGARAVRLALFADGGWAGERADFDRDDAVASAGLGLSVLDGILRLDAARSWRGPSAWRVDLYLDGLL